MKNHDEGSFEGKHSLEFQRTGFIMAGSRVASEKGGRLGTENSGLISRWQEERACVSRGNSKARPL